LFVLLFSDNYKRTRAFFQKKEKKEKEDQAADAHALIRFITSDKEALPLTHKFM
jgi:hypothetical protein